MIPGGNYGDRPLIEYTKHNELIKRSSLIREIFSRRTKGILSTRWVSQDELNPGHMCGTLRFGNDPRKNVLDAFNRAHDLDNLYVVDASFFPTSGTINPSLTIAANALRVAKLIDHRI